MTSACIRYLGVVRGRTDRRDQGFLYFCLDDCSAPADSYQAAMEVVEEVEVEEQPKVVSSAAMKLSL